MSESFCRKCNIACIRLCTICREAICSTHRCACDGEVKIPVEVRRSARDVGNTIQGGVTTPESRFNAEYAVVARWMRDGLMNLHGKYCDYCKVGSLCHGLEAMRDFGT